MGKEAAIAEEDFDQAQKFKEAIEALQCRVPWAAKGGDEEVIRRMDEAIAFGVLAGSVNPAYACGAARNPENLCKATPDAMMLFEKPVFMDVVTSKGYTEQVKIYKRKLIVSM